MHTYIYTERKRAAALCLLAAARCHSNLVWIRQLDIDLAGSSVYVYIMYVYVFQIFLSCIPSCYIYAYKAASICERELYY